MMDSEELLLDRYAAMFPAKRPESQEEIEAAQKLAIDRKAFLTSEAAARGIANVGTLQKKLDKQLNKKLKNKKRTEEVPRSKKADTLTSGGARDDSKASRASDTLSKEEISSSVATEVDLDEQLRRILGFPNENFGRGCYYINSDEILAKHLETTGGRWQTRFPPEPNGFLHIGHAKAMSINFGIAKANNGVCYLRMDDTNPESERQEYIDGIVENVKWLGHSFWKITHTSDYFDELFELACDLVKKGKAYVSRLTPEAVKKQRDAIRAYNSGELTEWPKESLADEGRDNLTPEENLKLFFDMRDGKFAEGEATLRMKGDFKSKNPNMWDHMAYRISYKAHPRTKTKWCIYPTYDFSHCIVDSLENITHSLCTLEFETRQAKDSSYHWLLDALNIYHPKTWETARCSVSYTVLSKRRLNLLVTEKHVDGWDDPRLLTLAGLRRRGYTPSSIETFCKRTGYARSSNEVCVSMNLLESCIRDELDREAPRRMAIINPLKLVIENFAGVVDVEVPNHPAKGREDLGVRKVSLTQTVFIPKEKFRLDMIKGFKGMVPGVLESIRLISAGVVTYVSHTTDESGEVAEVRVRLEDSGDQFKGISAVSWVPSTAFSAEMRVYGRLFKDCVVDNVEVHAEKAAKEKGVDFIDLLSDDSLQMKSVLVEPIVKDELKESSRWQFMTIGYFCIDRVHSTLTKPVFNQIVSLKESKSK